MGAMFAYPFRIGPNGSVVLTDENSDEGISQLIASAVLTHLGERPMFPTFGITDPVFGQVSTAQLKACLAAYGPSNAVITDVGSTFTTATAQHVEISWGPNDGGVNA